VVTRIIGLALLGLLALDATAAQTINLADREINLLGFGDVNYVEDEGDPGGFAQGQFVGLLSASLAERFNFFSEISATARDNEYDVEVERLFVRWEYSDVFKVSAGRFHTPLGYWNTAYHHGTWLHTSVKRPDVIKFGSRVIPIHFVGLMAEGSVPVADWSFKYHAGVGNGRYENIARAGDAGDINSDRAWLITASGRSFDLPVRFGASIYGDRVSANFLTEDVDEIIVSAYFVWDGDRIEAIAEYHHLDHELESGPGDDTSSGYYAQVGYRLPIQTPLTPYARIEKVDIGNEDPLLDGLGLDYDATVLGVRYDVAPTVALKGEYRREEFDNNGKQDNNFQIQLSFVVGAR
jgi:hypothetical protein